MAKRKYTTKMDFPKKSENQTATAVQDDKGTATRIKPLISDDGMVTMLMKIFNFMKKNYEEDKLHREEENNLKEGKELNDKRRHDRLIKAIEDLKKNLSVAPTTADKQTPEDTSPGILSWITNFFGGVNAVRTLMSIAGALISPLGLAILGVGSIAALLLLDKKPEETNKGLQTALGGPSLEAQTITDVVENTSAIERKKQNILANRPSDKKSMLFWKDPALQEQYLKEIGWDESTGTTKEEREKGGAKPVSPPTSVPKENKSAAPTTVPTSAKLNSVTQENNSMKVEAAVTPPTSSTINNVNASAGKTERPEVPRIKIPPVRNQEPTFQSMIIYSTRVV